MAIDKLQERIRKLKNPSMVDFSVELDKLPPHILAEESNEILAYERFCRELLDGLKGLVPAVRFNMGRFSLLGPDGLFLMSDGSQVPISRRKAKDVAERYASFRFQLMRNGGNSYA